MNPMNPTSNLPRLDGPSVAIAVSSRDTEKNEATTPAVAMQGLCSDAVRTLVCTPASKSTCCDCSPSFFATEPNLSRGERLARWMMYMVSVSDHVTLPGLYPLWPHTIHCNIHGESGDIRIIRIKVELCNAVFLAVACEIATNQTSSPAHALSHSGRRGKKLEKKAEEEIGKRNPSCRLCT